MPVMRSIVKFAVGYALTKAMARYGGPTGLLNAVMSSVGSRGDDRKNRGPDRTPRQKRADARRRTH